MTIIKLSEIELIPIRSQGAGGQNVNKVATAIHLRFDIAKSSLPDEYKAKLLQTRDERITQDGVIVIKAQRYRSQEQNRKDAIQRLMQFIEKVNIFRKKRKKTKIYKKILKKRIDSKAKRGNLKRLRQAPGLD